MVACLRVLGALALVLTVAGCGSGADEMLDTAGLEETQQNQPHARELYREILRKYPGTPQAKTAAERLQALGPE